MKFTVESLNQVETSTTDVDGEKRLYLEGPYMQCEIVNGNGRRYSLSSMIPAVENYQNEFIDTGRAIGELNHPDSPDLNFERACIRTLSLEKQGNDFIGKSLVTKGALGPLIYDLVVHDGVKVGVSSRALCESRMDGDIEVFDGMIHICAAADVVSDPSAPDAFVNGVLERKEYVIENGLILEAKVARVEKAVRSARRKDLDAVMRQAFRALSSEIKI